MHTFLESSPVFVSLLYTSRAHITCTSHMFTLARLEKNNIIVLLVSLVLKSCILNVALIQGRCLPPVFQSWTQQRNRNCWSLGKQWLGPVWQPCLPQGGINVVSWVTWWTKVDIDRWSCQLLTQYIDQLEGNS